MITSDDEPNFHPIILTAPCEIFTRATISASPLTSSVTMKVKCIQSRPTSFTYTYYLCVQVVLQLTPSAVWSVMFFIMLLALGFDSQFCILESLIVGLVDNWPKFLRPRRLKFTIIMVIFMFVLGLPQITNVSVQEPVQNVPQQD